MISPIYITVSVLFHIYLQLWYWGAWVIYNDVRIIIFEKLTHIVVEETSLGNIECWSLWYVNNKFITILNLCTNPSDIMSAITFGLYQTGFEYPGRLPILLKCVTHELQWTRRYFLSGVFMIFDRYFALMKVLYVDLLSISHPFSSTPDSYAAARKVYPTCITLYLRLLYEFVFFDFTSDRLHLQDFL